MIQRGVEDIVPGIGMVRDVALAPLSFGATERKDAFLPAGAANAPSPAVSVDTAQRLAKNHYRDVFSVLRRLGVPPDALYDAAQHVFLIASEKRDTIRVESERAFVVSVAVRTAANLRRSLAVYRLRHVDAALLEPASPAPLADELLEQRRMRSLLDEALDSLTADLRAPFVLFELEGMSLDEIAEALDIPRGTVASRLRRARKLFQDSARRLKLRDARGQVP